MEVWLSILISGILTAMAIIMGGYQMTRATERIVREMSGYMGKAIEAIHADIKHGQEKIERRMEERKQKNSQRG